MSFVYNQIMDFPQNKFEIKTVITKTFLNDLKNILSGSYIIHDSHMTGHIIGYVQDFFNKKSEKIKIQFLLLNASYFLLIFSLLLKV